MIRLLLTLVLLAALAIPPAWAACSNTTWLALCKPAIGDTTWAPNWNSNADLIDNVASGATEIRPRIKGYTDAAKPSAGTAGRLIRLSDTGLQGLWMDDGASAWLRVTPARLLTATASLDFTALAANTCEVLTITVTGAADGDAVWLGLPHALVDVDGATERTTFLGWVSAADTVSVRRCNVTGATTADPTPATVRAWVVKP